MTPKVSICVPFHDTPKTAFYLARLFKSISEQTFTDYELVVTKEGLMARNHNAAMQKATGEIVQIMNIDDYFAHPHSLQEIVHAFDLLPESKWQISACLHDYEGNVGNPHVPRWNDEIWTGKNTLGGMSTLSFRRENMLTFEEPLSWLVDCDLYYRLYLKYGLPILGEYPHVVIGTDSGRSTNKLADVLKAQEVEYLRLKYAK